ncbi:hypothetical protein [Methylocapsa aurea]|uniref:hypothetical protein n=1 Tax=Methylocapsa aurea TaxID=663610 RepID=UPI00068F45DA|nr:hypothetical protein [Methylocapsa aurea]
MKIFWAWQSDLPGKISRHFIRSALEEAIANIKEANAIQEPDEQFQGGMHLDHDRKGLKGSPDLAAEILKKIEEASVFVADVTPVGNGPARKVDDGSTSTGKRLMNPNVAIELGFALRTLGTEGLLMILNTHYGTRDSVPFDLAHKGGPILYMLAPEATPLEIATEKKTLVGKLVAALSLYKPKEERKLFAETPFTSSRAFFFNNGDILAESRSIFHEMQYTMPHGPAFYLRVIPCTELPMPIAVDTLLQQHPSDCTFGLSRGGIPRVNQWGVNVFDSRGDCDRIDSFTQLFRNGEIWGVNKYILEGGESEERQTISSFSMEHTFHQTLPKYLTFMKDVMKCEPPYTVEAGIVGVKGRALMIMQHRTTSSGNMYEDVVWLRLILNTASADTWDKFLLTFFEKVFSQTGKVRPDGLYGFPGSAPYPDR